MLTEVSVEFDAVQFAVACSAGAVKEDTVLIAFPDCGKERFPRPAYRKIVLNEDMELVIWGVVTGTYKSFR